MGRGGKRKKAAAAAKAAGVEPPADSAAAATIGEKVPPPPPSVEAANGDESTLDSSAAANGDGAPPRPPLSVEAPNGDKTEANGDVIPAPVESAAAANGDMVEQPLLVEQDNGGSKPMADTGLADASSEVRHDSSLEREGEVEKLKALNGMLVKEAVETRGQVAALAALLDERSADDGAIAIVEHQVLRATLVAHLRASTEEDVALRARLADDHELLQAAEARAAREADARREATARVGEATLHERRVLDLLSGKEAEAAAATKTVTGLEAVVSELAGKSTELCAENGELEKQLGEMSASADSVLAQKAEVEGSFMDYKKNTEMYKQEMERKLDEKSKQLEALTFSKAEMEVKFLSLESELSAAIARNRELQSEVETRKTELVAAKRKLEDLQFQVADVGKKYTTVVAEADDLKNEIEKMMTTKEAAAPAFAAEKTKLEKELEAMKRMVDLIQRNKDTDDHELLQAAEARAAREADARRGATARVGEATLHERRVLDLLSGKEAEAAAATKTVTGLEAVVSELAGKSTELCAENGELEKQLGEMSASADSVLAQKAEVEGSFMDYKKNTEMYKQEMERKLDEKSKQLEALTFSKAEMEVKFLSLESELSAAIARNRELQSEVETGKTELVAAKRKLEDLQFQVADVGKKYTTVVAEADDLKNEIEKMMTTKEAAAAAFAAEKTKFEKELEAMKRKVDLIQRNKDTAMASARLKDAEAAKLRGELNGLRDSITEQRALCEKLRANSSSLQVEMDTVQKALGEEKAQGDKLRLVLEEVEGYAAEKERDIAGLKSEVQNKRGQVYTLNGEIKKLQLAFDEAKQREKSGVWTWLCPTTTVIAAASFAYAARSR